MITFLWIVGILVAGALVLWVGDHGTHTFTEGISTQVQYYTTPELLAVHVKLKDGTQQVMVIRNITGRNAEEMGRWFNPEEADLDHIGLVADSIYYRWSNRTEDRDILQMGIFGLARKPNYQFVNGQLALGVGTEDFPPHSFTLMSEADFAKVSRGTLVYDKELGGRFTYSTHRRIYWGKKPTGYSGP